MQVMYMALADIFYTKIVNNEYKEDGATFLLPKARGGVTLILPHYVEASFKELVGKNTGSG